MIPNPNTCCLYEIEEGTKNERAAVGWDGNILRWGRTGGPEQQWIIVPYNYTHSYIVTVSNREHMAVGSNGNIRRWSPGGAEQLFEFVNPDSDGWWNIKETTRGQYVAVGSNGNILRWEWSGKNDQRFRLVPIPGPLPPQSKSGEYEPGQIPDIPRISIDGGAPPTRSPMYLIGQAVVPAMFVADNLYSDRVVQYATNPYYLLSRYQYWDRSNERGYLYANAGGSERKETFTLRVGIKETQSQEVERTLQFRIKLSGNLSFKTTTSGIPISTSGGGSIGEELSASAAIESELTQSLKVTVKSGTETEYERTESIEVTVPPAGEGKRRIRTAYSLVDRYVLTRAIDGTEVTEFEVTLPGVRKEDDRIVDS